MRLAPLFLTLGVALTTLAPSASALTVTNEGDETIHVWIENWMYRLRDGKTATFNPSSIPVTVLFESRHLRISCEAEADSVVRVTNDTCFVDGAESGESTFHL